MLPMLADKKKISDGIVASIVDGKEEYSSKEKDYPDSCKLAAMELIKAIGSKDIDAVISAFVALDIETKAYTDEESEQEIEINL